MKAILTLFMFVICLQGLQAQNVKKAKDLLASNSLDQAKTSIDQTLESTKNQKDPEAWYTKGKIYASIADNETYKSLSPNARMEALDAFKKAIEVDKDKTLLYLTVDKYQPVFGLYTGYFDQGAKEYNEEKYDDALGSFKNAGQVGDFIFKQGWGLYELDTTLTYYTALSAMNAKKEDEAATYFKKLADANVAANPEHATCYRWLAKYYYDKKDEANMNKYIEKGMQFYPKDDYLPLLQLDYIRNKGDHAALVAKYDELLKANPENYDLCMEYAGELFGDAHVGDVSKRPANYDELCKKIEDLYAQALKIKPGDPAANLSLGKHYYNMALFTEEDANKIRGANITEADKDKREKLRAETVALCDKAIVPLEQVFNFYDPKGKLKVSERSDFKTSCNLLMYCYNQKKDKAKVDFYQKKYDDADNTH